MAQTILILDDLFKEPPQEERVSVIIIIQILNSNLHMRMDIIKIISTIILMDNNYHWAISPLHRVESLILIHHRYLSHNSFSSTSHLLSIKTIKIINIALQLIAKILILIVQYHHHQLIGTN